MAALPALIRTQKAEFFYRAYVTDMLNGFMARGEAPRWGDMVQRKSAPEQPLQEGEAKARICAKLRR